MSSKSIRRTCDSLDSPMYLMDRSPRIHATNSWFVVTNPSFPTANNMARNLANTCSTLVGSSAISGFKRINAASTSENRKTSSIGRSRVSSHANVQPNSPKRFAKPNWSSRSSISSEVNVMQPPSTNHRKQVSHGSLTTNPTAIQNAKPSLQPLPAQWTELLHP